MQIFLITLKFLIGMPSAEFLWSTFISTCLLAFSMCISLAHRWLTSLRHRHRIQQKLSLILASGTNVKRSTQTFQHGEVFRLSGAFLLGLNHMLLWCHVGRAARLCTQVRTHCGVSLKHVLNSGWYPEHRAALILPTMWQSDGMYPVNVVRSRRLFHSGGMKQDCCQADVSSSWNCEPNTRGKTEYLTHLT